MKVRKRDCDGNEAGIIHILITIGQTAVYKIYHQKHTDVVNETKMSKVGAIFKAQKAQIIFLENNLQFLKIFSLEKCRIVPKNVKGGPFGFNTIHSVAKY